MPTEINTCIHCANKFETTPDYVFHYMEHRMCPDCNTNLESALSMTYGIPENDVLYTTPEVCDE